MRNVFFCGLVCVFALAVAPSEARALGVDVACAGGDADCSRLSLTETANSYIVDVAEKPRPFFSGIRFRKNVQRHRSGWWKRRFWRRWRRVIIGVPDQPVTPPDDPIAPTPDPVPEPGTLGLMALGGAFVVNRIRKRRSTDKV
ncbi:MAG: PEP-CTERM sorting domain-containing protein [Myxococcota bacterium]